MWLKLKNKIIIIKLHYFFAFIFRTFLSMHSVSKCIFFFSKTDLVHGMCKGFFLSTLWLQKTIEIEIYNNLTSIDVQSFQLFNLRQHAFFPLVEPNFGEAIMPLIRSWIFVVQQKELKRKKMSPLFWCWICAKWGELLLPLPLPLPLPLLVCSSNRLNSFENVLCLLLLFGRLIHLCSGTLLLKLLLLTHCRPWFPFSGTCYIPHTKKWHKKKLPLSFLMYNALMYSIQTNKHHWNGYSLRSQFIFIWVCVWVCVCVQTQVAFDECKCSP